MKEVETSHYPTIRNKSKNESISAHSLNTNPHQILYKNKVIAELDNEMTENGRSIFLALKMLPSSKWFVDLQEESQKNYIYAICKFVNWMNTQSIINLRTLKEFQIYEVNERKKKPSSCFAHSIKTILARAERIPQLSHDQHRFLQRLASSTTLEFSAESLSIDLTHWFSKHQWIRGKIGNDYLNIESPKRMHQSFSVVVAEILIFILEARNSLNDNPLIKSAYLNASNNTETSSRQSVILYANLLQATKKEITRPEDKSLYELISIECIKANSLPSIRDEVKSNESYEYITALSGISKGYPYTRPHILSNTASELEELLMYWLVVSLAVQPSDAVNIGRKNIAVKKNKFGRVKSLQIIYFKGRSDKFHETPILSASNIITRVLLMYLETIPQSQSRLFLHKKIGRNRFFCNPLYKLRSNATSTPVCLFLRILADSQVAGRIKTSFQSYNTSDIFHRAMTCFLDKDLIDFNLYSKNIYSYDKYKKDTIKYLPHSMFTPTHIKNTAVFSRSDIYRDGDLVNQNSHTPLVEKTSYMTDDNKEWVNQVGRISRMVMHDIQQEAYSNITKRIKIEIEERKLLTTIIGNTSTSRSKIKKLNNMDFNSESKGPTYIVVESVSNAIRMLHYISQAKKYSDALIERNHEFYMNTVLINVEWMHYCITLFSSKTMSEANKKFIKIKNVLPNSFESELNAGV